MDDLQQSRVSAGDVLSAIRTLGVCGTYRKTFSDAIPDSYLRIVGHQIVDEVLEAPSAPGTRVMRVRRPPSSGYRISSPRLLHCEIDVVGREVLDVVGLTGRDES